MSDAGDPSCCACGTKAKWGLAVVVFIACATRLIGLGSLDVWGDEVYSHDASTDLLPKLLRWETASNESSSPLPFIEQKITRKIFGEASPLALRVPSAVHGILSVALFYIILARFVGAGVAFWAALLLAINPFTLEWSREGRMYTQWTTATLLLILAAYEAVRWTRTKAESTESPVLNWRWWVVGILFMYVHAMNVMGVMTIAGVGLWLGLMGLIELAAQRRTGLRIVLGSALASGVYLCSWGLTGIAKILLVSGGAKPAKDFEPPVFTQELLSFLRQVPGHVPTIVALLLWLIVAAGLVTLLRGGRWRIALLLTVAAMAAWLGFPSVAKSHFFAPRYVFTGALAYCLGLGAAAAWLARRPALLKGLPRQAGVAAAAVLVLASAAVAWPFTHEVFFVSKIEARKALAPVQRYAAPGDAFILVPDYFESFNGYKPYEFGEKVAVIRGPVEARYGAMPDEKYKGTFEALYPHEPLPGDRLDPKAKPATQPPAGTWLFLLNVEGSKPVMARWDQRIASIRRVLHAYGLKEEDVKKLVTEETYTLTLRLTRGEAGKGKIEHITPTQGRRFR